MINSVRHAKFASRGQFLATLCATLLIFKEYLAQNSQNARNYGAHLHVGIEQKITLL